MLTIHRRPEPGSQVFKIALVKLEIRIKSLDLIAVSLALDDVLQQLQISQLRVLSQLLLEVPEIRI